MTMDQMDQKTDEELFSYWLTQIATESERHKPESEQSHAFHLWLQERKARQEFQADMEQATKQGQIDEYGYYRGDKK